MKNSKFGGTTKSMIMVFLKKAYTSCIIFHHLPYYNYFFNLSRQL